MLILASVVLAAASAAKFETGVTIIAGILTITSLVFAALYKIHKGLSKVEDLSNTVATLVGRELNHNGGGSVKDMARDARDGSRAAQMAAEYANARSERLEVAVDELQKGQRESTRWAAETVGATNAKIDAVARDVRQARTVLTIHVDQASRNEQNWHQWAKSVGTVTPPEPVLQPVGQLNQD